MAKPRLISPLLDGFIMGDPISDHHGISCCPALKDGTEDKYIVKVISIPASSAQMEALLLTGAYPNKEAALTYYKDLADETVAEIEVLEKLSEQEGFSRYDGWQIEPKEDGYGFEIYLLRSYNRTLERHLNRHSFSHLDAQNLALDLCAALSICRSSGYLYVGLKPNNIFVTDQQQYKIGGLGFLKLDALKYASLPDKYRSEYTPGEVNDAFAALNTTMDIYAVGLILYQLYNNGQLPFDDTVQIGDKLPAPMYADQEMATIILKACDPDPAARWQEPSEMGQAIIDYMQKNGAVDSPIVPVLLQSDEDPAQTEENPVSYEEDEYGNLSFLGDLSLEDLGLTDESDLETFTCETTDILSQADELANRPVPEPVVVPDHVDLPELPPQEPVFEINTPPAEDALDDPENSVESFEPKVVVSAPLPPRKVSYSKNTAKTKKKKAIPVRGLILVFIVLALLLGGFLFYNHYYLITIDDVFLYGSGDSLTVRVSTKADDSLLQVICTGTYGSQVPAKVVDGKAEFTGLDPSTAYRIKITAEGFHKVIGVTSKTYSTPMETKIANFDAITGANDGSVVLKFTVEGPDSKEWKLFYSAEGEEERSIIVQNHTAAINDLTVHKEYRFRLEATDDLFVTGMEEITYTTQSVVLAENIQIVSCANKAITIKWATPSGVSVPSWTVSCSGDAYNNTISTSENTATFTNLDNAGAFIIEVKANGMSKGVKINVDAYTTTVSNMKSTANADGTLRITWSTSLPVPADGWKLCYNAIGTSSTQTIVCFENSATISQVIPNATYRIWLTDAKGKALIDGEIEAKTASAPDFTQDFGTNTLSRENLEFSMCKTVSLLNWDGRYTSSIAFTNSFAPNIAASFLVKRTKTFTLTEDPVEILFIIRKADGTPINTSVTNTTWKQLFSGQYAKLHINANATPTTPGTYTVDVYFNGGFAVSQEFIITK